MNKFAWRGAKHTSRPSVYFVIHLRLSTFVDFWCTLYRPTMIRMLVRVLHCRSITSSLQSSLSLSSLQDHYHHHLGLEL